LSLINATVGPVFRATLGLILGSTKYVVLKTLEEQSSPLPKSEGPITKFGSLTLLPTPNLGSLPEVWAQMCYIDVHFSCAVNCGISAFDVTAFPGTRWTRLFAAVDHRSRLRSSHTLKSVYSSVVVLRHRSRDDMNIHTVKQI